MLVKFLFEWFKQAEDPQLDPKKRKQSLWSCITKDMNPTCGTTVAVEQWSSWKKLQ